MRVSIYFIFLISIVFTSSEILLRNNHFKPKVFKKYSDFKQVDSLYTYRNYTTDEAGVYKFSHWVTDSLRLYIQQTDTFSKQEMLDKAINPMDGIFEVYTQFNSLVTISKNKHPQKTTRSIFQDISQLNKPEKRDNEWVKVIDHYLSHPFNKEGFRSIEFDISDSEQVKILLIGDSFVYGISAKPFHNSYSDILLSKNYKIFNTGIPGADPAQYAAIAKKYIPLLKPDLVIVNFFSGNDFMDFSRNCQQDQPHEHMTNAGFFESNPLGKYLSAQEAYSFYLSLTSIPQTSIFNKICSKSALLTVIWGGLYRQGFVSHPTNEAYRKAKALSKKVKAETTSQYIEAITNACKANETPLLYTIIPYKEEVDKRNNITVDTNVLNIVFNKSNYYYPKNLTPDDFMPAADVHFNNNGALKYANFLDSLIQMQYIH